MGVVVCNSVLRASSRGSGRPLVNLLVSLQFIVGGKRVSNWPTISLLIACLEGYIFMGRSKMLEGVFTFLE
jgi:hypothetical protein